MFGVGPICKRSQGLNDAMDCVTNGIAEGAFVVVAHEEMVTKGINYLLAARAGAVGGVMESERHAKFALPEDSEDVI